MQEIYDVLAAYARSVQPLVFETELAEFPFSVAGTAFLVGFEGRAFAITTRHGLRPDALSPVRIFASDASTRFMPLDDVFYVPVDCDPEDFMDLAVISIDSLAIDGETAGASLIALSRDFPGWPQDAAELVIMGYPEDFAFIDLESKEVCTGRVVLNAHYVGLSSMPYLHEAQVIDRHTLSTFSGFSGGPVFAVLRPPGQPATVGLCGMAIRGTSASNAFHFLDRTVLMDALKTRLGR